MGDTADNLYLQDIQPTRVSFFLSRGNEVLGDYTMYMLYDTQEKQYVCMYVLCICICICIYKYIDYILRCAIDQRWNSLYLGQRSPLLLLTFRGVLGDDVTAATWEARRFGGFRGWSLTENPESIGVLCSFNQLYMADTSVFFTWLLVNTGVSLTKTTWCGIVETWLIMLYHYW